MSDKRQPPPSSEPAHPTVSSRGHLRLVRSEEPQRAPASASNEEKPALARSRSNLVNLMTAYADAIDRDIRAILELP